MNRAATMQSAAMRRSGAINAAGDDKQGSAIRNEQEERRK
jgi:hypothetical protein